MWAEACGVDLYLDQQSIDTTTPSGKLMFQFTGVFAEFERAMIRQRIHAGLKRAVANGKRLGRPLNDPQALDKARQWLGKGLGINKVGEASRIEQLYRCPSQGRDGGFCCLTVTDPFSRRR
jgi:DNA invertase Pin-like site-specific DNA recombinase